MKSTVYLKLSGKVLTLNFFYSEKSYSHKCLEDVAEIWLLSTKPSKGEREVRDGGGELERLWASIRNPRVACTIQQHWANNSTDGFPGPDN